MNIIVRPAHRDDAELLARIGAATFALACPPDTSRRDIETYIQSELTPQRFREHLASPAKSLYVAGLAGSIVGYLMLCREPSPSALAASNPLELRRIYVLRDLHGSGAAAMLMTAALQQAAAGEHDVVWLGVSKHNDRALAFYRKHGFSIVAEQGFRVGNDVHEDFIMSRSIKPGG